MDFSQFYDDAKKQVGLVNFQKTKFLIVTFCNGRFKGTAKEFNGIKTVFTWKIKENERYHLDFRVSKGKAKLIVINQGRILILGDNENSGETLPFLEKGTYRVRLVGESCSVNFVLEKEKIKYY